MGIQLIDCHAHLDQMENLGTVLERAPGAGVEAIIAVSENAVSARRILEIAREYESPRIFTAIGLYPAEVTQEEIITVSELIGEQHESLVALGEIGLDYWIKTVRKDKEEKALQRKAFRLQLELANKYSLPPIIHSRGAWEDCYRLVKDAGVKRAIFHWYSGPLDLLEQILKNGYHISATPAAASSPQHRAALAMAPLKKIILETDCPVPRREGETRIPTEPADVLYSLKAVAELKKVPEDEVAAITTQTAIQLFNIKI